MLSWRVKIGWAGWPLVVLGVGNRAGWGDLATGESTRGWIGDSVLYGSGLSQVKTRGCTFANVETENRSGRCVGPTLRRTINFLIAK